MAFEKQNNKLKESLKETNRTEEQSFMPFEKTKNYTFTLLSLIHISEPTRPY